MPETTTRTRTDPRSLTCVSSHAFFARKLSRFAGTARSPVTSCQVRQRDGSSCLATAVRTLTDGSHAVDVDDRVTVLDVSPARYRVITHRLERWTVDGVPRVLLGAARPLARGLGRADALDALAARQQDLSTRLKRTVGEKGVHAHVDPLVLARYVERTWGDLLVDPVLVTWGDPRGIPLATRLARANPDAHVVRTAHHDLLVDVLAGASGTRDTD